MQSIIDNPWVILASLHTLHNRHRNKQSDTHPSTRALLQRLSQQTNPLKVWERSNICKNNKVAWNAQITQWRRVCGCLWSRLFIPTRNCSLEWHSNSFIALALTYPDRNNWGNHHSVYKLRWFENGMCDNWNYLPQKQIQGKQYPHFDQLVWTSGMVLCLAYCYKSVLMNVVATWPINTKGC